MGYTENISEIRSTIGMQLARRGLELGAVRLNTREPFRWASGYRMPIYNDNRTYLQDPESRRLIVLAFTRILEALYCKPDWIAGTATAGIPHAASLADALSLPMCYVRSTSKDHGLKQAVEGLGQKGSFQQDLVVLIEDLISTGGSSLKAVEALRDAGARVPYCLAIFSYGLQRASEAFSSIQEPCIPIPILLYDDLAAYAAEIGFIEPEEMNDLIEWRMDPFSWGEKRGFL